MTWILESLFLLSVVLNVASYQFSGPSDSPVCCQYAHSYLLLCLMAISNISYIEQKQPASARFLNFAEFEARIFLWNRPYKRKNASEMKITTQINVFWI